jgi:hypothetical protein
MKIILFCLLTTCLATLSLAQQPKYDSCQRCFPFSNNINYHEAANPDLKTITTDMLRELYIKWDSVYIVHQTDGTAYIKNDEQKQQQDGLTTSEANGYGMVIEALMAGLKPGIQANFDQLYAYALKHHIAADKKDGGVTSVLTN